MAKAGCSCCRVAVVLLVLLLLAGGGGIGVYFAVSKSGAADPSEVSNTKPETKKSGESKASNFGDRDKPVKPVNRFYGMSYSPFGIGDNQLCPPWDEVGGLCILSDQVKADMRQIAQLSLRVKTYSLNCLPQTKTIVEYAQANKMTIMLGVWVDKKSSSNDAEIERLVEFLSELGNAGGTITDVIVGNEAIFVQKAKESELLRMIKKAKSVIADAGLSIRVGTAEIYQIWTGEGPDGNGKPITSIAEEVDFFGLNTHAYYAGIDPLAKDAAAGEHVLNEKVALEKFFADKGIDKPAIISETGFPSEGPPKTSGGRTATPSIEALSAFAKQIESVSRAQNMPVFFFEPYNSDWKRRWLPYTDVDYNFGLHTCDRKLKKGLTLPDPGAR
jgi:exo-beta-1,3-glucanase (GH17 family)